MQSRFLFVVFAQHFFKVDLGYYSSIKMVAYDLEESFSLVSRQSYFDWVVDMVQSIGELDLMSPLAQPWPMAKKHLIHSARCQKRQQVETSLAKHASLLRLEASW